MIRAILIGALLTGAAGAQTVEGPETFEVASVKPAAPQDMHRMMMGMRGGPGTPDPETLTCTNFPLKQIIGVAYDVKAYQISGPAFLETERFDITAKIAKGATKEQFRHMLQNLLVERFHMSLHREKKDFPMYGLVVAKSGLKVKESEPPPPTAEGDGDAPAPLPPPGRLPVGKDGFPQLPKTGRTGMMVMFNGGRMRMTASNQTMTGLADMLSNQLGRPVVNEAGLTGKYDFNLDFAPDPGMRGPMGGAMPPPPPSVGGDGPVVGPGPGPGPAPAAGGEGGPSLVTAVQEQLGLKLESKKGPLDLLVIDKIEKTPTEN